MKETVVWKRKYDSGFILQDGTWAKGTSLYIPFDWLTDWLYKNNQMSC